MKHKTIKVLSLFDGISVAQQALKELGYTVEYYASEIDPYAIAVTQKNHPETIQLGSVVGLEHWGKNDTQLNNIDLLIGGSPCQDLSIAKGNREGLAGKRSGLFYEYLRILKEVKPRYYVLENVASMSDEARDEISKELGGVEPITIDAALVSAQNRKRYFWTNIPGIKQPEDRGINILNIIEPQAERKYIDIKNPIKTRNGIRWDTSGKGYYSQQDRAYSENGKHPTVPTARTITKVKVLFNDGRVGVLTWKEIERLQSLPDNYTDLAEGNRIEKRGAVIGNAYNKEVIKHILSYIKP